MIGIALLLKKLGIFPYFNFRETWPFILIAVGLFVGIQKKFTNNAWWILILIGVFNLIPYFSFTIGGRIVDSKDLLVPSALILGGLFLIFKPKRDHNCMPRHHFSMVDESMINSEVVFGGRKELITSKDFQGGKVSATFGGCEVNLLQADSASSTIILDVRATFGGIEIIVPSNWELKNEIEPIFGSVEDQRSIRMAEKPENRKVLILRGSCVFGGIEIKSI
ncbi:MAG: hypothetical protein EOP49_13365 [Sphingobacteriales bacterium]|nr:MAG: hypothetical protein EOP49_13365 [Sphingobacteriales bacterium]